MANRFNRTALLALLVVFPITVGCQSRRCTAPSPGNRLLPQRQPVIDGLPASFTERVPNSDNGDATYRMVLIPGDDERDLPPFYIGQTEVTWGMFMYWAYGEDIEDLNKLTALQRQGLRPSPLGHGHPQFNYGWIGNEQYPAMGLSWQTARQYCIWLSGVTGRIYRLPMDEEWKHVSKLAGGIPQQRDELLRQGVFLDNTPEMDQPPFIHLPREVAQGLPNKLDLYDWLGNAAEWVQPAAGKRWVRGGHYLLPVEAFDVDWFAAEDQQTWNASYPQIPVSDSWYIDQTFQGFRLVCEAPRIATSPSKE